MQDASLGTQGLDWELKFSWCKAGAGQTQYVYGMSSVLYVFMDIPKDFGLK